MLHAVMFRVAPVMAILRNIVVAGMLIATAPRAVIAAGGSSGPSADQASDPYEHYGAGLVCGCIRGHWTDLVTFSYDSTAGGNQGLGRRTGMSDFSGSASGTTLASSATWTYDTRGRISSEAQTILGTAYTTSFTYDSLNRLLTTTYPAAVGSETVTTTYGAHGLPVGLSGTSVYVKALDASNNPTTTTYTPLFQPLKLTYGNDVVADFTYHDPTNQPDASQRDYRLKQLRYTAPPAQGGGTLQQHAYTYDRAGNLLTWGQTEYGGTVHNWTFTYDVRDRLLSASATNPPTGQPSSFSYSYDRSGDITSGPAGAYTYGDPNHAHAATAAGSSNSYTFDANGAVLARTESGTAYAHAYDAEGRQVRVVVGSGPSSTWANFVYNGDGDLVAKQVYGATSTQTTHYVASGLYERDVTANTSKKSYRFGGKLVAVREVPSSGSTTLHYLQGDHLGSTSLQTSN